MRLFGSLAAAVTVACLLSVATATHAQADRNLLSETALQTTTCVRCPTTSEPGQPPPEGQIEGPCGLAVSPAGDVYLADYYHRTIDRFTLPSAAESGSYVSQIVLPGGDPQAVAVNTLDAVCGLAVDASGRLYGNEWHQGVSQLSPSEAVIDDAESTGLAIDRAENRLYVDDRTYVAEYALPFDPEDEPLAKIGLGSIAEGYGLAAFGGRVYVADASVDAVKVFEPATSSSVPVATIGGQFNSLREAAMAVDPTNGHLLVVDNREPGFERPRSAVVEFGSSADGYAYLGTLPGAPIDGGPSGIAVDESGQAIVTDGNSELSNAFLYGPYSTEGAATTLGLPFASTPFGVSAIGQPAEGGKGYRRSPDSANASEVSQRGGIRVRFQGKLVPRTLPRHGHRPVIASVGATIFATADHTPRQLRRIEIAINRNGHFSPGAMPRCRLDQIQPATTSAALASCRRALVGQGHFSARILLPQQAPFPSSGKVYAFNGRWRGSPAILAHVYGTDPVPVSYTIPFEMRHRRHGTYGTLLRASLPAVTGDAGYVTGLSLTFGGGSRARGYVTAGCPAPRGISIAPFPFAHAVFAFADGPEVGSTLIRTCRTR